MSGILVNVILPLYLLILLGFFIGRLKRDVETQSISFLVLFIFAPALIISSFRKVSIGYPDVGCTVIVSVAVVMFVWLCVYALERFAFGERFPALELSSTIMNSGYLGIPLIYLLFGEKGLPYGISFMVAMTLIHFTFGILILQGSLLSGIREALKIPVIYAIFLSFLLKGVHIPEGFEKMVELTGNATMPLMLVSIGISLSRIEVSSLKLGAVSSAFRLTGGFLFSSLPVLLLHCNPLMSKVLIVQSSLPPAVLNFVLCDRFGKDPDTAASSILIGTLISPVWIAVVVKLLPFIVSP